MPICNENVTGVFASLRATYESVQASSERDRFDFFVLSDNGDTIFTLPGWISGRRVAPNDWRLQSDFLSPSATPGQAQEQQYQRLLPPLGLAILLI